MRWLAMQWRDCTTKCSSGNTLPLCRKNPRWRRKLDAHANCWSGMPNSAEWRGENNDTGFGLRSASGRSGAETERRRERRRSATPPPSRRRKPAAVAANSIAARDERAVLRRGTGVVERVTGRRAARGAQQTVRWSRRVQAEWGLSMVNSNAFFLSLNLRQNQAAGIKLPVWKR